MPKAARQRPGFRVVGNLREELQSAGCRFPRCGVRSVSHQGCTGATAIDSPVPARQRGTGPIPIHREGRCVLGRGGCLARERRLVIVHTPHGHVFYGHFRSIPILAVSSRSNPAGAECAHGSIDCADGGGTAGSPRSRCLARPPTGSSSCLALDRSWQAVPDGRGFRGAAAGLVWLSTGSADRRIGRVAHRCLKAMNT